MSKILAIESSCDDTAAAVISDRKILSNITSSQKIHEKFGGVVPELASREHQKNIIYVVQTALNQADITKNDLDAIAFTQGPGLMGSLLVGVSFAKAMAQGLEIPIITVDHLEAHLAAHFIDEPKPEFPFLCLLVSGGHTIIVKMENETDFQVIGKTTDDAAGEAFDKAAKILGLPYPGGPMIDKSAEGGNVHAYQFPEPDMPGFDFSFSGLKTSFLYFIRDHIKADPDFVSKNIADICASYQHRIVSYLLSQLQKASLETGITNIGISGGVAANSYLRKMLGLKQEQEGFKVYIPKFEYCTDNAGMVAMAASFKYEAGTFAGLDTSPYARKA